MRRRDARHQGEEHPTTRGGGRPSGVPEAPRASSDPGGPAAALWQKVGSHSVLVAVAAALAVVAAAGGTALSVASVVARLSTLVLIVLGAGLVVSASLFHGRSVVHRRDPEYRRGGRRRRLLRRERRLGRCWFAVAAGLCVVPLILPPVIAAGAGVAGAATLFLSARAAGIEAAACEASGLRGGSAFLAGTDAAQRVIADDARAPKLPFAGMAPRLLGPKEPPGTVSAFLNKTLVLVVVVGAGYCGVVVAHAATAIVAHVRAQEEKEGVKRRKAGSSGGRAAGRGVLSYAEHCPELPDPLDIGHGLGELFRHDGAVEAACGEAPLVFPSGVVVSRGLCGSELRSLAVAASGRDPVLLYGDAAAFAWEAALAGELSYAERALPRDGDLSLVTTATGTHVFARARPSVAPRRARARHCSEIDETARPFTVLRPALAYLWHQHVRRFGWAWPVDAGGSPEGRAFVDPRTGRTVATGRCDAGCELRSARHPPWTLDGVAFVELDELRPVLPPG
jgi:hypothetical protein